MKKSSRSSLVRRLSACRVPAGQMALAWLGQSGFLIKSPRGTVAALDPYLSNSCETVGRSLGVNMRRMVPAPLAPADLQICDALCLTHSHQDHLDPETLGPYLSGGGSGPFLAPHAAAEKLAALGVPADAIHLTWPNNEHCIGDLTIKATFAIPLGPDDLTHVGYLVTVRNGPRIYFTGDTDYNDILALSMAPERPDILATVINSAFRNLSPADAARLAKALQPRWVIPCHHDLFPDNCIPARVLHTNLAMHAMGETFCPLEHGKIRLFSKSIRGKKLWKTI